MSVIRLQGKPFTNLPFLVENTVVKLDQDSRTLFPPARKRVQSSNQLFRARPAQPLSILPS
jgi:hypothetical protein